jgi:hypothetical protein
MSKRQRNIIQTLFYPFLSLSEYRFSSFFLFLSSTSSPNQRHRPVAIEETPPPKYEEDVGMMSGIPANGNLDREIFEQTVIANLERLEAVQNEIAAAIHSMQQSHTRRQTRQQTRGHTRRRRLLAALHGYPVYFYLTLLIIPLYRLAIWGVEIGIPRTIRGDTPEARAECKAYIAQRRAKLAEARQEMDSTVELTRDIWKSLKNGTYKHDRFGGGFRHR